MNIRHPLPPFTRETALEKVRLAENAWNSKDPQSVSTAYSIDTQWRNRNQFVQGREQVKDWLQAKWEKELDYRLIKELFTFSGNRIAVRYAYEWRDRQGNWFRSYGNENWVFDENGLMRERYASINDLAIAEAERKFLWSQGPRPKAHPGLSELGL